MEQRLGRPPEEDTGRDRRAEHHREPAPAPEQRLGARSADDRLAERRQRCQREKSQKSQTGTREERAEMLQYPVVGRSLSRDETRALSEAEDERRRKGSQRNKKDRAIDGVTG